jgi:hypothetical protein
VSEQVAGCRSICKALDQGWVGFYIDYVEGNRDVVDPMLTLPGGKKIRWSQQFLQVRSQQEQAMQTGPG